MGIRQFKRTAPGRPPLASEWDRLCTIVENLCQITTDNWNRLRVTQRADGATILHPQPPRPTFTTLSTGSNQDNLGTGGGGGGGAPAFLLITPTADIEITGLQGQETPGSTVTLINLSPSFIITLTDNDASSDAGNQFQFGGDDFFLGYLDPLGLVWDPSVDGGSGGWIPTAPQPNPGIVGTITTNYTVETATDNFLLIQADTQQGNIAITLPNNPPVGFQVGVEKPDATSNLVTVTPGTDASGLFTRIGGGATGGAFVLTQQGQVVWLEWNGSFWSLIGGAGLPAATVADEAVGVDQLDPEVVAALQDAGPGNVSIWNLFR